MRYFSLWLIGTIFSSLCCDILSIKKSSLGMSVFTPALHFPILIAMLVTWAVGNSHWPLGRRGPRHKRLKRIFLIFYWLAWCVHRTGVWESEAGRQCLQVSRGRSMSAQSAKWKPHSEVSLGFDWIDCTCKIYLQGIPFELLGIFFNCLNYKRLW